MDLTEFRELVVTALFADDQLMDIFVLKGGNALELAYELGSRASVDIDVSMAEDFKDYGLNSEEVKERLTYQFNETFKDRGYKVFDVKIKKKPRRLRETQIFWGGYELEFKIIKSEVYEENKDNPDALRRAAEVVLEGTQVKRYRVDISRYEYVETSEEQEFKDYIIRVYTPLMIVYEKLRAICQQMEEYKEIMHSNTRPRARDFYDIYVITNTEALLNKDEVLDLENLEILKAIFEVKSVPLELLDKIKEEKIKEFHEPDFATVRDIVLDSQNLESFDFYYDYVVSLTEDIKAKMN